MPAFQVYSSTPKTRSAAPAGSGRPARPRRGRHRDPIRAGVVPARLKVAVTTGTVAGGVALATIPAQAALAGTPSAATTTATTTTAAATRAAPPTTRVHTLLLVAPWHSTVRAGVATQVTFGLFRGPRLYGVPNQRLRIQVLTSKGWATFKYLQTDRTGFAHYTARILTTTKVRATYAGTGTYAGTASANVGELTVGAAPARTTATSLATVSTAYSTSSLGARLVSLAASHAGAAYVYGGSGPYSFDCSGLVQYIYGQLGRSVPRTAQAQYDASTKIATTAARPGDLVFFGGTSSIYHVGIYAGGGMMWAAPHTGAVVSLQKIWTTDYHVGRIS